MFPFCNHGQFFSNKNFNTSTALFWLFFHCIFHKKCNYFQYFQ